MHPFAWVKIYALAPTVATFSQHHDTTMAMRTRVEGTPSSLRGLCNSFSDCRLSLVQRCRRHASRRSVAVAVAQAERQAEEEDPSIPTRSRRITTIPDSAHESLLGLDATNVPRPLISRAEVLDEAHMDAELIRSRQADASLQMHMVQWYPGGALAAFSTLVSALVRLAHRGGLHGAWGVMPQPAPCTAPAVSQQCPAALAVQSAPKSQHNTLS